MNADRKAKRAAYMREWWRKRRDLARNGAAVPHGTSNGYRNWGCRCDACRAANLKRSKPYPRNRDKAKNVAASMRHKRSIPPEEAPNSGKRWTGAELDVITARAADGGYLHTEREAARMLGRSLVAVEKMRQRCLSEPKYITFAGAASGPSPGPVVAGEVAAS